MASGAEDFVHIEPSLEIGRLQTRCAMLFAAPPPPFARCPPCVVRVQRGVRGWLARRAARRVREDAARAAFRRLGQRLSARARMRLLHFVAAQRALVRMSAALAARAARRGAAACGIQRCVRRYIAGHGAVPRSKLVLEVVRLRKQLDDERRARKRHRKHLR